MEILAPWILAYEILQNISNKSIFNSDDNYMCDIM